MEELIALFPEDPAEAERVRILDSLLATPAGSRSAINIVVRPTQFVRRIKRHLGGVGAEFALGLEKWGHLDEDPDAGYYLCLQPMRLGRTASKIYLAMTLAGKITDLFSIIGMQQTELLHADLGIDPDQLIKELFQDLAQVPRPFQILPLAVRQEAHYFVTAHRSESSDI